MIKVMKYINAISDKEDVRVPNQKVFQLKKILNSKIENFIKYYSFEEYSQIDESSSENEKDDRMEVEARTLTDKSLDSKSIEVKQEGSNFYDYVKHAKLSIEDVDLVQSDIMIKSEYTSLDITPDANTRILKRRIPPIKLDRNICGSFSGEHNYTRGDSFNLS
jgi:hypothetical protein